MQTSITTIKLRKETKERIDKLKVYRRETYDEVLQEMLSILSICKFNPEAAKHKLLTIEQRKKQDTKEPKVEEKNPKKTSSSTN